ncbi:MAG: hypothetical protein M3Q07_16705 [Pseudobdellovibrionaceae bacterium]|nr:hypothetical protein [Pseudobdellovibrionaceae bacterium]
MRCLFLLLVVSLSGSAMAAPKTKKKRVTTASRTEDLRMWDGSVADVSWVNENTAPRQAPKAPRPRPWFSISGAAGHRVFQQDTVMIQQDENQQPLNEGQFADLIDNQNNFELRVLLHPFSFLSLGAAYHLDEAKLKVNDQAVSIAPQEFSGTLQIGPRLGPVRIYGFYSHIFASQSQATIAAPTRVGDASNPQTFKVDVKQTGGEAGLGAHFQWGYLGIFAEARRSTNRSYALSIAHEDDQTATFQATTRPSFKAWQLGLSLDI